MTIQKGTAYEKELIVTAYEKGYKDAIAMMLPIIERVVQEQSQKLKSDLHEIDNVMLDEILKKTRNN